MPAIAASARCPWGPHELGSEDWCPSCQPVIRDRSDREWAAKKAAYDADLARIKAETPLVIELADALDRDAPYIEEVLLRIGARLTDA